MLSSLEKYLVHNWKACFFFQCIAQAFGRKKSVCQLEVIELYVLFMKNENNVMCKRCHKAKAFFYIGL